MAAGDLAGYVSRWPPVTWRPLPTGPEGREPKRIGETIDAVTRRLGTPPAAALAAVFSRWEQLVGPDVAAHATPVSLRNHVLVVAVDQPAWATQLRYLSADLLRRVAQAAGADVVSEVEVRVTPRPGERPERRSRAGRRPDTPL